MALPPEPVDCWFLTGPTASGKTAVGLELARLLGAEIISMDSMALYRGMDVGTAKPTAEEQRAVPHHLIDVVDPDQDYSLAQYVAAARDAIAQIHSRGRQVLFVGQGHYSALKFIRYDAAANAWKLQETPSWWKGDARTGKGPIGHAYYNNAIDPLRGILYHHQSATRFVHRYDVARDEWTTLPEIPGAATGHGTALAYFPERKGLVRVRNSTR